MSARTAEEIATSQQLRANYQAAFAQWALQISRLQAFPPCSPAAKQAQGQADAAEAVYRFTRDRLADDMN